MSDHGEIKGPEIMYGKAFAQTLLERLKELERENAALLLKVQDLELQNNAMRSTSRGKEVAKNERLERENAALKVQIRELIATMEEEGEMDAVRIAELKKDNAALRAALDAQMQYQRDLRADRDRLDWLTSFHGSGWLRLYLDMNDTLTRNEIDRRLFTEAPDAYWRNKEKQP